MVAMIVPAVNTSQIVLFCGQQAASRRVPEMDVYSHVIYLVIPNVWDELCNGHYETLSVIMCRIMKLVNELIYSRLLSLIFKQKTICPPSITRNIKIPLRPYSLDFLSKATKSVVGWMAFKMDSLVALLNESSISLEAWHFNSTMMMSQVHSIKMDSICYTETRFKSHKSLVIS